MFLADFHIHSTFSDGKLAIPEIVDLYGRHGFGAIAITDHLCEDQSLIGKAARILNRTLIEATFPLYQNILRTEAERAWAEYRMVLIPGVELTQNTVSNRRSAHIVGLGVTEFIRAEPDALLLARAIRARGGLAIAAHPVHTGKKEKQTFHLWDRREELRAEFDAWEVASGQQLFDEVVRSDLPKIASSDLHHPRQFSSWKTVFHCDRDRDAIFEAIRSQEINFQYFEEKKDHDDTRLLDAHSLGARFFDPRGGGLGLPAPF